MEKPLAAYLNDFRDGEWAGPVALLTLVLFFGTLDFAKAVLFVVFAIVAVHIIIEQKNVMQGRDRLSWGLYTMAAFAGSIFLMFLILPVYALVAYSVFISHIKHKRQDDTLFQVRLPGYIVMGVLVVLSSGIYGTRALLTIDDLKARQMQYERIEELKKENVTDPRLKIEKLPSRTQ